MVFCTRKWEQDRKTVSESLLHLRDYPEKYFFLIHCEGTRFTEKKHQISMQVAQAKGLPSLKHHLLPRTKGFAITVRSLRNVVSAVYDCTLNFRNNENPTLLGVLNGKKYHADLYVRRIPLGEVPEDEDRCAAWLHKLYQEKVGAAGSGSSLTLASFVLVFFVGESGASGAWAGGEHLREGQGGGGHRAACGNKARLQIPQVDRRMLEPGPETPAWRASARAPPLPSVGVRWMIGVTEIDKGSAYGNMDSKLKHSD
ncbi:hypothetical protein E2I00_017568 [Balaenoptera physalus]|uniref:1-acylglycerol-3-phosphate O-acyltransferase n=1 Tax=Balaenoptera physalus TaxID=9770 RepID=A0A6A1QBH5_BALPH|nr:hypothetical protein E2I00_017568 [Balaenoptera physalus]